MKQKKKRSKSGITVVLKKSGIVVKDKESRVLLVTRNDRVLITRYKNMDDITKKSILELYAELTGENVSRAKGFLDFESEEAEFCS